MMVAYLSTTVSICLNTYLTLQICYISVDEIRTKVLQDNCAGLGPSDQGNECILKVPHAYFQRVSAANSQASL